MRNRMQGRNGWAEARFAAPAALALCGALLGGCASGNLLKNAEGDRDLITGSVPTLDRQDPSDEATIRNAVTSADLAALGRSPLAWANAETGASGVVEALEEVRRGDRVCRSFNASRENYEGVHLYSGEACFEDSVWRMTRFKAL